MPRQEIEPSRDQICEKRSDLLWKDYENKIVTLAKQPEKKPPSLPHKATKQESAQYEF
jgi:hypothetical protein